MAAEKGQRGCGGNGSDVRLLCGLIGFTDDSLVKCGRFYPSSCKTGSDRLKHYCSKFPIVEIDTSHYAIPSQRVVEDWVKSASAYNNFKFHLKAYGMFTLRQMAFGQLPHEIRDGLSTSFSGKAFGRSQSIPWETVLNKGFAQVLWGVFNGRVRLLQKKNMLGLVLFQFQLDFVPNGKNRRWVEYCRTQLPVGTKMGVEFRCRDWYNVATVPDTTKWLRATVCVEIVCDELLHELHRNRKLNPAHSAPSINSAVLASTHLGVSDDSLVYVRVHRREGKERLLGSEWCNMWKKRIVEELLKGGGGGLEREVHFLFGTAWEDQAVKNANLLYKVVGVDVGEAWRRKFHKNSALGRFFKVADKASAMEELGRSERGRKKRPAPEAAMKGRKKVVAGRGGVVDKNQRSLSSFFKSK